MKGHFSLPVNNYMKLYFFFKRLLPKGETILFRFQLGYSSAGSLAYYSLTVSL